MWPLVEVHTTGAVWYYFFILWAIVIIGPCALFWIIDRVYYRNHCGIKFAEIDQEIAKAHGQS